jgi:CDP-diacylglycerol--glycerol-3-phosphate 3-phosphatidyltransferase
MQLEKMFNLPNVLSISRFPVAFLLLFNSVPIRVAAILIALFTDYMDGFLARRNKEVTRLGTILDPLTDRFFVLFAAAVFLAEGRLTWWAILALFTRDIFLVLFWGYLRLKGSWETYRCRATLWGKVTTVFQLGLLLAITFNVSFPPSFFIALVVLGALTFFELLYTVSNVDIQKK